MRNTSLVFRTLTSLALPLFVGCAASDVADAPEDESVAEIQEAASGYGRDGSDPNACVDGSTVTKATKNLMVNYEPWDANSSEAPWGKISLKYSATCKTFWAKTELVAPLMEGETARAEVVRFGNHKKTLTCEVPTGKTWCYTPQLHNDGSAFTGQIFADYKYQFRPGRWTVGKKSDSTSSVTVNAGVSGGPGGHQVMCEPGEQEYTQYGLTNYKMSSGDCWSPDPYIGRNKCGIRDEYASKNCVYGNTFPSAARRPNAQDGWEVWYKCCPVNRGGDVFASDKAEFTDGELTEQIDALNVLIDKNIFSWWSGTATGATKIALTKAAEEVIQKLAKKFAGSTIAGLGQAVAAYEAVDLINQWFDLSELKRARDAYQSAQADLRNLRGTHAVIGQEYRIGKSIIGGLPAVVSRFGAAYYIGITGEPAPPTQPTVRTGTVNVGSAGLSVRTCPETTSDCKVLGKVYNGEEVTIYCQAYGTEVTGPYGTSKIWDYIGTGYVSDAYVNTGGAGLFAPLCE